LAKVKARQILDFFHVNLQIKALRCPTKRLGCRNG
jgi:hypothetical protein